MTIFNWLLAACKLMFLSCMYNIFLNRLSCCLQINVFLSFSHMRTDLPGHVAAWARGIPGMALVDCPNGKQRAQNFHNHRTALSRAEDMASNKTKHTYIHIVKIYSNIFSQIFKTRKFARVCSYLCLCVLVGCHIYWVRIFKFPFFLSKYIFALLMRGTQGV